MKATTMNYVKMLHTEYAAAQTAGCIYTLTDRQINHLAGLFLNEGLTPAEYSMARALGEDPDQILIDVAFAMVRNPVYLKTTPTNAGLTKYFHQAVRWNLMKLKDKADPYAEDTTGRPVPPQDPIGSRPIPELENVVDKEYGVDDLCGDDLLRHANFLESMDLVLRKYGSQAALAYLFRGFGFTNLDVLHYFTHNPPARILRYVESRLNRHYGLFEENFLRSMIPAPGDCWYIDLSSAALSRLVYNIRNDLELLHAGKEYRPAPRNCTPYAA